MPERLNSGERAALGTLAARVDLLKIRVHRGQPKRQDKVRRAVLWASRGRAVALGNHVFLPDSCAGEVPVLAHEVTHCAQYQEWGALAYFGRGAITQLRDLLHRTLGLGESPYAYQVEIGKPFEAYGMEQQAQIVEDSFRGDATALLVGAVRLVDV
ncbi:MAG: DUF4157 domain-containing protein [Gemmatimonadales bacterium]